MEINFHTLWIIGVWQTLSKINKLTHGSRKDVPKSRRTMWVIQNNIWIFIVQASVLFSNDTSVPLGLGKMVHVHLLPWVFLQHLSHSIYMYPCLLSADLRPRSHITLTQLRRAVCAPPPLHDPTTILLRPQSPVLSLRPRLCLLGLPAQAPFYARRAQPARNVSSARKASETDLDFRRPIVYEIRNSIYVAMSIIEFSKGKDSNQSRIINLAMSSNILTSQGQRTKEARKYLSFLLRKYLVDVGDILETCAWKFVPCWFDVMPKLFLRGSEI